MIFVLGSTAVSFWFIRLRLNTRQACRNEADLSANLPAGAVWRMPCGGDLSTLGGSRLRGFWHLHLFLNALCSFFKNLIALVASSCDKRDIISVLDS